MVCRSRYVVSKTAPRNSSPMSCSLCCAETKAVLRWILILIMFVEYKWRIASDPIANASCVVKRKPGSCQF